MNVAIYYHPEAYTISGPRLMGRNVAGKSFLEGYLRYSRNDEIWIQADLDNHFENFVTYAKSIDRKLSVNRITQASLAKLKLVGNIFYPGPTIGEQAFYRTNHGHDSWSISGVTHTTSSIGAMDAIANLLVSPTQPWDALICTSESVKSNVRKILEAQIEYLTERLGITKYTIPLMPIIPLGIDVNEFEINDTYKVKARNSLLINDGAIVILYTGRLSFHSKANPMPLYLALEKIASNESIEIVLIECGWYANEAIQNAYETAAEKICPNITVLRIDGRDQDNKKMATACADIFCSLSDSIQETFGITPIEAMAARLPVVVSDWDGYKETVRDGVDGFRIPTMMPRPGLGADIAYRYALGVDNYDQYCAYCSSLVAVDVYALEIALARLINSKELRQTMGSNGYKKANEIYDWSVIIPQYEELWDRQKSIRLSNQDASVNKKTIWAARLDPFYAFSEYATFHMSLDTRLSVGEMSQSVVEAKLKAYLDLQIVNYGGFVIPRLDELIKILALINSKTITASEIIQNFDGNRRPYIFRGLVWMLKYGILTTNR